MTKYSAYVAAVALRESLTVFPWFFVSYDDL